jgi:hypothetical protein
MHARQSAAVSWWKDWRVWAVIAIAVVAVVVVMRFAATAPDAGADTQPGEASQPAETPAYDGTALAAETEQAVLEAYGVDAVSAIDSTDGAATLVSHIDSWESFSEGRVTNTHAEKLSPEALERVAATVLDHASAVADLESVTAVDVEGLAATAERPEGP